MTEISHEQARQLIHLRADKELNLQDQRLLEAHLEGCHECRTYAKEVVALENYLREIAFRKWNKRPTPLSMNVVLQQVRGKQWMKRESHFLVTRMVAIVFAALALLIGTWQFSQITSPSTPQMMTVAMPIPTPSTQLTHTSLATQACEYVTYQIKDGDTLEGIALQFGVAKPDLVSFNQLEIEALIPGTELKIPLCKSTPTGTINAPTTTITITPQLDSITTTPG